MHGKRIFMGVSALTLSACAYAGYLVGEGQNDTPNSKVTKAEQVVASVEARYIAAAGAGEVCERGVLGGSLSSKTAILNPDDLQQLLDMTCGAQDTHVEIAQAASATAPSVINAFTKLSEAKDNSVYDDNEKIMYTGLGVVLIPALAVAAAGAVIFWTDPSVR